MSPLADLSFEVLDGVVVARLQGEIDMSNASDLGAAITARVPSDARGLVVDLTGVHYLDSAGIKALFELRERLMRRGQEIKLAFADDSPIATTLEYAGVQSTLGSAPTVQGAIADLED